MIELTPKQVRALNFRLTATCTTVIIRPWDSNGRYVEVSQFDRLRLIETVKIAPGGTVKVLT